MSTDSLSSPPRRTLVAILTRERPVGLRATLESVGRCRRPEGVVVEVVVIDNEPAGSAERVVHDTVLPIPVNYCHEPRVGIPIARNRALDAAEGYDHLAFIDDDETADPEWLVELHRALDQPGADAATGPVIRVLPPDAPGWIARGGLLDVNKPPDGTEVATARTGNVLMRMATVESLKLRFDERFPLLGGEDSWFFGQLSERGGRIIWAERAVVSETVPASRATFPWLVKRAYRLGLADARRRQATKPGIRTALHTLGLTARRMGVTLRMLLVAPREGRAGLVRAAMKAATTVGGVAGMIGVSFDEYRTVDGN